MKHQKTKRTAVCLVEGNDEVVTVPKSKLNLNHSSVHD